MSRALQDRRALVTGGSRGIGAAVVRRLARDGADVAPTSVSRPEQAEKTARAARDLGAPAIAIPADSADAGAVTAAVERTVREPGGIDILVASGGIALMAPIDERTGADGRRQLQSLTPRTPRRT